MSELLALGYVGVETARIDEWRAFATDLLGMQVVDRSGAGLALRMDDRRQRFLIDRGEGEGCRVFGWEVADAAALDRLGARLERAGVTVTRESAAMADRRLVTEVISFRDPLGNRLEAFCGPLLADAPFAPGRNISGFRTGALGVGHVVLTVEDADQVIGFYTEVLGLKLSDYTLRPFKAFFFHVNARHHSFAVVQTGTDGVHHVMVELMALDDVGQGYDLAQMDPGRVGVTLGRHTNDLMTSFYAKSPSGFMIEYGWGGRDIDTATWQPFECDYGPSLWGHERSWLSDEKRAEALALRLDAAAQGKRAPVHVLPGHYEVGE